MKTEDEKQIKLLQNKPNITTFISTFKNLKSYFIFTRLLIYCFAKLPWISASFHLPSASIYVVLPPHELFVQIEMIFLSRKLFLSFCKFLLRLSFHSFLIMPVVLVEFVPILMPHKNTIAQEQCLESKLSIPNLSNH